MWMWRKESRSDLLYKNNFQDPEELKRLELEREKEFESKECKRLVDEAYIHLGIAFSKGEKKGNMILPRNSYPSTFECAKKILKSDNIDLVWNKDQHVAIPSVGSAKVYGSPIPDTPANSYDVIYTKN